MTLMTSLVEAADLMLLSSLSSRTPSSRWNHKQQQQQRQSVDVIGIVYNISKSDAVAGLAVCTANGKRKSSRSWSRSTTCTTQKVDLWLTDPGCVGDSTSDCHVGLDGNGDGKVGVLDPCIASSSSSPLPPHHSCLHVVLYGSCEVERVEQEQIRRGSILRLNGLCRQSRVPHDDAFGDGGGDRKSDNSSNKMSSLRATFKLAFGGDGCINITPGSRWFCFGHASSFHMIGDDEDDLHSKAITTNMMTPKDRITELVKWWRSRYIGRQSSVGSMTSGGAGGVDDGNEDKKTSAAHSLCGIHHDLELLPCRKRKLNEVQSLGMISNIQVCVTDVRHHNDDTAAIEGTLHSSSSTNVCKKAKNNRKLYGVAIGASASSITAPALSSRRKSSSVVFATVADDSTLEDGAAMTFIDTSGKFMTILKTALDENNDKNIYSGMTRTQKLLILTNVRTKNSNSLRGLPSFTEDLVLVPTNETTASIVEVKDNNNSTSTKSKHNRNDVEEGFVSASQRRRTIVEEMNVQSQHNEKGARGETNNESTLVVSSLEDFRSGGRSLRRDTFTGVTCISQFRRMVIKGDKYRNDCILTLATRNNNDNNNSQNNNVRYHQEVHAGSAILQMLCGGLDASEMLEDDEVCKIAMDLVHSIIERQGDSDPVELAWTIKVVNNQPYVIKVSLHP